MAMVAHGSTKEDIEHASSQTRVKLLFFNTPGTLKVVMAYMVLKADGNQDLSSIHYKNFGNFTGTLSYHNLDGSFEIGYTLKEGKVLRTLSKGDPNAPEALMLCDNLKPTGAKPGEKLMLLEGGGCTYITYDLYYETCVYVPSHPDWGTTCTYDYAGSVTVVDCPTSGGNGGYTGGDSGAGGGSGGGTTTPPTEPTPDPYNACDRKVGVNAVANNTTLAAKNNSVKQSTIDNGYEYGYEQKLATVGGSTYMNILPRTDSNIDSFTHYFSWDATLGYTIGYVHSHPHGMAPSLPDVFAMYEDLNDLGSLSASTADINFYKSNSSITVITATTTYVVTVKDWTAFGTAFADYSSNTANWGDSYNDIIYNTGSSLKALLSLLGDAVNVYQSDSNGVMKPQHLDSNGNVSEIACPGAGVE